MLAFEEMMRHKIVMPAHFLRASGDAIGGLFEHFSHAAERLGVYTAQDYVFILRNLLKEWEIDSVTDLNDQAEKSERLSDEIAGSSGKSSRENENPCKRI